LRPGNAGDTGLEDKKNPEIRTKELKRKKERAASGTKEENRPLEIKNVKNMRVRPRLPDATILRDRGDTAKGEEGKETRYSGGGEKALINERRRARFIPGPKRVNGKIPKKKKYQKSDKQRIFSCTQKEEKEDPREETWKRIPILNLG